jgi:hypothetical protein
MDRWFGQLVVGVLVLCTAACGPGYLDAGKRIPATDENREVYAVVKAYHTAVEGKDVETLRKLVSHNYHENGGTTDDPSDDYGYDKLLPRLELLSKHFKRVQMKIRLIDLQVGGQEANVDIEYVGRALLSEGNQEAYSSRDDFARMRLAREDGHWRIVGGL